MRPVTVIDRCGDVATVNRAYLRGWLHHLATGNPVKLRTAIVGTLSR